ncbi:MAG: cytochrome P450 [Steroidobacteraceae bacterium]
MNAAASPLARPHIPDRMAAELADPQVHASERIHEIFSWLRANEPLGIAAPDNFVPFWVVTKQRDLRIIATMREHFFNADRIILIDLASEQRMQELLGGRQFPIRTILQMDPPDHAKYRALTAERFQPRAVDALTRSIQGIAKDFVDRMLEKGGTCDFAADVAFAYPLRVIMSILGVPVEDEPTILRLTQQFFGSSDKEFAHAEASKTAGDALAAVTDDFNAFFDALFTERRAKPREDVLSLIANGKVDGKPVPQHEQRSYAAHLATAGHDTTSSVISAGVLAWCRDPALFKQLKADASLMPAFVEEAIRFGTASKITMRTVVADVHACDRDFRKGDWVAMAWASGNRDDDYVEDPHTFRIDRKPNRLISFGHGAHVCLGQYLARLEMRMLFTELLTRLDSVELAGEPRTMSSLIVSGLKTLPIRFRPS